MIKDIFGSSISEKFFGKKTGNVEQEKNNKLGVAALKIIAKDTLVFGRMSRELKAINSSFRQLVRLEGGEPAQSESLKSYNNKYGSMKELHIADRKVKRMKEEQRPADFLVVLFDKFTTILKIAFLGTLLSGIVLSEKIIEWMDLKGMYTKLTSFFSDISEGVVSFFRSIDWATEFQNHIGNLIQFISFGMFTKKDALIIVEGAGNFTSSIMHRFGEVLLSAAKILKEHLEKLGRFLAIDVLGVDYEEMEQQKKERDSAVELSESLKKDNDTLDAEMKSLQDKRNILNDKKYKREKEAAAQKAKQAEEEAKKKETVGDKLKRAFTPKEDVVEEKPIKVTTGAAGFGLTAPSVTPAPAAPPPKPTPAKIPDDIKQNITKQDKKAEEEKKPKAADSKSSGDEGMQYPTTKGQAVVTSKYGMRMHPVKKELKLHTGLDYAGVPENSPIQLVSSAKVQKAGEQTGYGNMIDAEVNGETLRFAHLNKMFVKAGDMIEPGTIIGLLGKTGIGTGAHLHFEHRTKSSFGDGEKTTYDPLKTGAPSLIAIGDKPVRMIADQKYDSFAGEYNNQLSAESSSLAKAQREQMKRQNPVIINAPSTNNTAVKNKNNVVAAG